MASIEQLRVKLNYANKRCSYAWAKYFEQVHLQLVNDHRAYQQQQVAINDVAIPEHIKGLLKEMADELKKRWSCPICMEMIDANDLEITNCGHYMCKGCFEELKESLPLSETKWKCPVCRRAHNLKD